MDTPLESGHERVELSKEMILLRMVDVLTTPYVCEQIYQTFTETHSDSMYILRRFLETYKCILTDYESKDRLQLILWLKDVLHAWTCNKKDCYSFQFSFRCRSKTDDVIVSRIIYCTFS